tara:strand:- start:9855 stop:10547 length:693 start_codon:yes stop_codon:yes gene_type:complete
MFERKTTEPALPINVLDGKGTLGNNRKNLISNVKDYFYFFVTFIPILIPACAILSSAFEGSFKGFIFVLGLLIAVSIGRFIAITLDIKYSRGKGNNSSANAICSIYPGNNTWGKFKTLPDPHAIMLAFTFCYIVIPIFLNNRVDWGSMLFAFAPLLLFLILSGWTRIKILCCSLYRDIVIGWLLGALFGTAWYFIVIASFDYNSGLTYFENRDSKKPCSLKDNVYACRKP